MAQEQPGATQAIYRGMDKATLDAAYNKEEKIVLGFRVDEIVRDDAIVNKTLGTMHPG